MVICMKKKFLESLVLFIVLYFLQSCSVADITKEKINIPHRYSNYKLVINYESIEYNLLLFNIQKGHFDNFIKEDMRAAAEAVKGDIDKTRYNIYSLIENSLMVNNGSKVDGYLSVIIREADSEIQLGWWASMCLFPSSVLLGFPFSRTSAEIVVEVAEYDSNKKYIRTFKGVGKEAAYLAYYYGYKDDTQAAALKALKSGLASIRQQMEEAQ